MAIALTAIVVVPMLFDPDPKPLGSDVDIRIPAQESPFEPATVPGSVPSAAVERQEAAVAETPAPAMPEQAGPTTPAEPTPTSPPPKAAAAEPPREAKKAAAKPAPERNKSEAVQSKPDPAFASRGYYLQLGAFSSEGNAKALLAKVESAGFKVGMLDSNGQYRVRVGPIPDRDKALETLSKLRSKGFSPVMIGP